MWKKYAKASCQDNKIRFNNEPQLSNIAVDQKKKNVIILNNAISVKGRQDLGIKFQIFAPWQLKADSQMRGQLKSWTEWAQRFLKVMWLQKRDIGN